MVPPSQHSLWTGTQHGLYSHPCTHAGSVGCTRTHTCARLAGTCTHTRTGRCRQPAQPSRPAAPRTHAPGREPAGKAPTALEPLALRHPHWQSHPQPHAALAVCIPGTGNSSRDIPHHQCSLWDACRHSHSGQYWGWLQAPWESQGLSNCHGALGVGRAGVEVQPDPGKGCVPPGDGAGADLCPELLAVSGCRSQGDWSCQPHGREQEVRGSSVTM